jgi:hypothetical protein
MYCSTCGVAVAQGLSYCNHCGSKLNRGEAVAKSSEIRPSLLVNAMVVTFIFGLVAITVLMGVMKTLGVPIERVLIFTLLPFLLMLVLEGVFMRLLLRRNRGTEESDKVLSKQQSTNELDAAQTRVLPEGMPSVTEHTTRAFDPIYTDRTSNKTSG